MRILVAEDEPKIGAYLQQGLSEAGFAVERVENGSDALQHALEEGYDLLILDVMMPGCLLYTSPSPRDLSTSRMPSSA